MAHLGAQRRAVATIRVALAAIATAYRLAGHPFDAKIPALAGVVEGITRTRGAAPERQARPATLEILQAMLAACGPYQGKGAALAARNRAMLLLGFGAALRRQELVGLNLADVELVEGRGIMVKLRRSKTDQHGEGQGIAVPANEGEPDLCPARALKSWLVHRLTAGDIEGDAKDKPLFCAVTRFGIVTGLRLSDKAVVRLVKAMAASVGQDAARFSGHSLRAGFITEADAQEAGLSSIMRQARHKKAETTLRYTRPAELWRNNAGTAIFGKKRKKVD
jgi:integrase